MATMTNDLPGKASARHQHPQAAPRHNYCNPSWSGPLAVGARRVSFHQVARLPVRSISARKQQLHTTHDLEPGWSGGFSEWLYRAGPRR
jgi:hypothetical protein